MHADLLALAALCLPTGFDATLAAGLYGGLFLLGFTGSLAHCGPMCGPLVLAQVGARLENARLCEAARWRAGLLPGYHGGRLMTYSALGILSGLIPLPHWLSPVLLILGALLMLLMAVQRLTEGRLALTVGALALPGFSRLGRTLMARPGGPAALGLGMLLGFIPCGLVYAALTLAAATGKPLAGGVAMLCFGLGTVPLLAALGIAGSVAARRWQAASQKVAPFLLLLSAGLIGAMAASHL
jgi:sulfite exporter TauE/SafE